MTNRTKWNLLGGLLLVWIAVITFRVLAEPEPQRVPLKFVSGQALTRATAQGANELPASLRPPDATPIRASFRAPKNIFAPLDLRTDEEKAAAARARLLAARKKTEQAAIAAAPAPPPPTPEELAAQEAQRQAELARQQREQAIQQARTAMSKYRFLGYLTRNGAPQAFLGKGNDIYIVKTGETVEGKIKVTTIDTTTVKLIEGTTNTEASLLLVKEGS